MTEEQAIKVLCMIETHGGLAFKAKEIAIEDIKNMEEIKEIIECDADAKIKLKMISNIVYSKPHYFKVLEQEPITKITRKYCVQDEGGYTDEELVNKINEIIDRINKEK